MSRSLSFFLVDVFADAPLPATPWRWSPTTDAAPSMDRGERQS
jgi:hypothetical protein